MSKRKDDKPVTAQPTGSRIVMQPRKDSSSVVRRQIRLDVREHVDDEDIVSEFASGCYRSIPTCRE